MVKLTLIHDELPDEQAARDFREGWAPILSSLKTYLESGSFARGKEALQATASLAKFFASSTKLTTSSTI